MSRTWLALLVVACAPRSIERVATPMEGISIALYGTGGTGETGYGVIDDRRWIEVTGNTIFLDRIEPDAELPTLVIEPLGGDPITIGSCVRERIDQTPTGLAALAAVRGERRHEMRGKIPAVTPATGVLSPVVRCTVTAPAGRHFVRVLHVTPALRYRTQHDVTMVSADRAQVLTRFAISTPAWRASANVAVFDGMPGGEQPPRELAHGPITLDGGTSVLLVPQREVGARMRRVYDGAQLDDAIEPRDLAWGKDSRTAVWIWLELDDARLPPGPVHARVETAEGPRDLDVPAAGRERTGTVTRLPMWVDEEVRGSRRRTIERADGLTLSDRVQLSVANTGTLTREIWIEERLRPARRRQIVNGWPARHGKPTIAGDVVRTRLVLAAGATERLGYTIRYEF